MKYLITTMIFLVSSCSHLAEQRPNKDVWESLDDKMLYYVDGNMSEKDVENSKEDIEKLSHGKCTGPNNVEIKSEICKQVKDILSNIVELREAFDAKKERKEQLEWINENVPTRYNTFASQVVGDQVNENLTELTEYQNNVNEYEKSNIIINKVIDSKIVLAKNFPLKNLSQFYTERMGDASLLIKSKSIILQAIQTVKKVKIESLKLTKHCDPFEAEVKKIYMEMSKIPELILKENSSLKAISMDREVNKRSAVYADRLKAIQFNEKNKGCPSYIETRY